MRVRVRIGVRDKVRDKADRFSLAFLAHAQVGGGTLRF